MMRLGDMLLLMMASIVFDINVWGHRLKQPGLGFGITVFARRQFKLQVYVCFCRAVPSLQAVPVWRLVDIGEVYEVDETNPEKMRQLLQIKFAFKVCS